MYWVIKEGDRRAYEVFTEGSDFFREVGEGRCRVYSYDLERFLDVIEIRVFTQRLLVENEKMYSVSKN